MPPIWDTLKTREVDGAECRNNYLTYKLFNYPGTRLRYKVVTLVNREESFFDLCRFLKTLILTF